MQALLIATHNQHKTSEFRRILGEAFTVEDLSAYPAIPPVEETGETFVANATLKAVETSHHFPGRMVLADDSGLEVDALDGQPGVRSARYSGPDATDASNRTKLIQALSETGVRGPKRSGRFRCTLILAKDGEVLLEASGAIEGILANEEKGDGGFGYDPLFIPEGHCQTFAELPPETKNEMSHRGRAADVFLRKWKDMS